MKLIFANPLELTAAAGWVAFAINAIAEDGMVIWFDGVPLVGSVRHIDFPTRDAVNVYLIAFELIKKRCILDLKPLSLIETSHQGDELQESV